MERGRAHAAVVRAAAMGGLFLAESSAFARRAIERKRDGFALLAGEVEAFVRNYLSGEILEEQMASLLMAGCIRGWSDDEIDALTRAYVASGSVLSFATLGRRTVDKHSTGGVGDAVSLAVVPWVAACGASVVKLSGRALAHTGGTIDKLETIPGLRTALSPQELSSIVSSVGCAIGAAGPELAPADKRIYALRDRCGSVPSMGLIAASVVSKKLAGGADAIVFDVKVGAGAFMRTRAEAAELARTMVDLARRAGRSAVALLTDMEEPLGTRIGTGLEIVEALEFLRGNSADASDARLAACCEAVACAMLSLALDVPEEQAVRMLREARAAGAALARFEAMIRAQGGDWEAVQRMAPREPSFDATALRAGYLVRVDVVGLGELAREVVATGGPLAGLQVRARIGERVEAGSPLVRVHGGSAAHALRAAELFEIGASAPPPRPIVYERIGCATERRRQAKAPQ
ncbi:thymidine phosphorylase [bacterium]|nr:MAG: thymidine phosphorylase [bacterium]